jgi:hypothetical protein
VNCNAHKPQILKGLPTLLVSNPIGCGGWIRTTDLWVMSADRCLYLIECGAWAMPCRL